MLKRIKKAIRKQLLKIDWIQHRVADYHWRKKRQEYHELWAKKMSDGGTTRVDKPCRPFGMWRW